MKALHERLMWVFTIKRNGCYHVKSPIDCRITESETVHVSWNDGMGRIWYGFWSLKVSAHFQFARSTDAKTKQPLRQYHEEVDRQVFLHDDWLNFFNNQWHWEGEGIRSISTSYNVCTLFIYWFEQTNCEKALLSYWKQLKMDWVSILKPRNCHYYQFCLMGC